MVDPNLPLSEQEYDGKGGVRPRKIPGTTELHFHVVLQTTAKPEHQKQVIDRFKRELELQFGSAIAISVLPEADEYTWKNLDRTKVVHVRGETFVHHVHQPDSPNTTTADTGGSPDHATPSGKKHRS